MKNIFKKNQIIITALAIMIAVAGYLNYLGDGDYDGEDTVANADVDSEMTEVLDISQEDMNNEDILASNEEILNEMLEQSTDENGEIPSQDSDVLEEDPEDDLEGEDQSQETEKTEEETIGEATLVNGTNVDLISEAKLNREQIRSKNKELLMEIIENGNVSESQKSEAVSAMIDMSERAEKELETETLLQTKGFEDAVVSISDEMVDVVINEESLSDAQRAQIEDIVKRKTGVEGKNIIITPIAK